MFYFLSHTMSIDWWQHRKDPQIHSRETDWGPGEIHSYRDTCTHLHTVNTFSDLEPDINQQLSFFLSTACRSIRNSNWFHWYSYNRVLQTQSRAQPSTPPAEGVDGWARDYCKPKLSTCAYSSLIPRPPPFYCRHKLKKKVWEWGCTYINLDNQPKNLCLRTHAKK